ncbi:DUF4369 domain-containing protein [Polaribacter marinivivus]|uniref:DUF4369 domain-containing protein n=1 Tax=Polaribacter marinivivus TaxID=1524260 RepID=A0ABV8RCE8_9FLAO|nr:DUF4369 domain-containing protein [uncultured Polaribacter sp.]
MRKIFLLLSLSIILFSCSKERETNMIVTGQIKGLKKGKLYLQKMKDTLLVTVDSIALIGTESFELKDFVDSPVLYYLTFDANNAEKSILFFGEEGTITINDNVENFGVFPEINGSKNQVLLDKYKLMSQKFQEQNLELIKLDFEAKKANDKNLIEKVENDYKRLVRRRVLYTANFAITNADSEVAPYLALTELYDATLPLLDTVNAALSDKIKASTYGKRYQEYLEQIKKQEKNKK